jgi:hypothetical protein
LAKSKESIFKKSQLTKAKLEKKIEKLQRENDKLS